MYLPEYGNSDLPLSWLFLIVLSLKERVIMTDEWEVSQIKKLQTHMKIVSPDIPQELAELTFPDRRICNEDYFELGIVSNCIIENQTADHVFFDKVIFKNVIFKEIDFSRVELTNVVFQNCDLSNVNFDEGIVHQVELNNCKILGINLLGTTLRNVLFDNCCGDYATFRNVNCKQVKFDNSSLAKADFYESTLRDVYFSHSNLDQMQLSGTKLTGIDLSSCEFSQLGVNIEDVKGCIVSPQQAVGFSKLFGLIVND